MAACAIALAALLSSGGSTATTLLEVGVDEMSAEAELVVQGHVAWDDAKQQGPDIYTYTGIEVTRCIAGECPEAVTLKHRGGTVGQHTLLIPGMPRFEPGQEVLLFLRPDPEGDDGLYSVLAMVQGFFLVLQDPETGDDVAVQQLEGVSVAAAGEDGLIVLKKKTKPVVMELSALVSWIQQARAAAEKQGGP
jgi:hypothetical protein